MPDAIEQAIEDGATQPKSASADGVSVDQHPIGDLIEADKYLTKKTAVSGRNRGLRFSRIRLPGFDK